MPSPASDSSRAWPPIPGATLILNGELDLIFRLPAATFAAAAVDARRVRLAGATHLANLDRPRAFSEAVRRFARSLPADRRPDDTAPAGSSTGPRDDHGYTGSTR